MTFILELHWKLALGHNRMLVMGVVALLWTIDCFGALDDASTRKRAARAADERTTSVLTRILRRQEANDDVPLEFFLRLTASATFFVVARPAETPLMSAVENEIAGARPTAEIPRGGRIRKIWTAVHRWIGIIAGVYIVIAGVTGSILAFWQDIDEWLNKDIMRVAAPAPNATYRPLSEIIAAAKAAMPEEARRADAPIAIKLPRHPGASISIPYFLGLPDKATLAEAKRTGDISKISISKLETRELFVDPYRAVIVGERLASKGLDPFSMPFIQIVNHLHLGLWIPFVGGLITAFLALFLLIGVVDGLALWWPRRGKWIGALTLKKNASTERFVFDLHKIFGVYFGAVLIISIFSGMYMNFKPPWRALVSLVSTVHEKPKNLHSQPANDRPPLTVEHAFAIADRVFPDGELQYVALPMGEDGVFAVGKRIRNEVNETGTHHTVTIDQYSGEVLHKIDPREYTLGEKFFEWQYPLHSGEAFGDYGRAFMVLFGAVPVVLYLTGFIRWRHKRRARRAADRKVAA